jgi:hypothetical protein
MGIFAEQQTTTHRMPTPSRASGHSQETFARSSAFRCRFGATGRRSRPDAPTCKVPLPALPAGARDLAGPIRWIQTVAGCRRLPPGLPPETLAGTTRTALSCVNSVLSWSLRSPLACRDLEESLCPVASPVPPDRTIYLAGWLYSGRPQWSWVGESRTTGVCGIEARREIAIS